MNILPAHKIPEDCKEEIREMYADGLTVANIARYIGLNTSVIRYILDINGERKRKNAATRKWQKSHPKQWKKIVARAQRNYQLRKKYLPHEN